MEETKRRILITDGVTEHINDPDPRRPLFQIIRVDKDDTAKKNVSAFISERYF